MSDSLRLFVALWPPAAVRDAIAEWQAAWAWPARVALVKPERLHLTLHFLGDVAPSRTAELKQALGSVPFTPFTLHLGEPEIFGGGIAVLRPDPTPAALGDLHARVGVALAGIGLPLEQRPYRPHVTLARRASGASPPRRGAAMQWKAESGFVLAHSVGGGRGYEILAPFGVT